MQSSNAPDYTGHWRTPHHSPPSTLPSSGGIPSGRRHGKLRSGRSAFLAFAESGGPHSGIHHFGNRNFRVTTIHVCVPSKPRKCTRNRIDCPISLAVHAKAPTMFPLPVSYFLRLCTRPHHCVLRQTSSTIFFGRAFLAPPTERAEFIVLISPCSVPKYIVSSHRTLPCISLLCARCQVSMKSAQWTAYELPKDRTHVAM